ncbi:MAG: DUF58 domain-containing protein [Calothrix sp. SM1_7_51]|nr:DUF58 domain-containing protein [Calothrix sp. SM1_7_51]
MKRITNWLEHRVSAPTFSGWVLIGISICFLGAAINTMAGWLYVISGVSFALLGVAAFLPPRSLTGLTVNRLNIEPVTVKDDLTIELRIVNQTKKAVSLLQAEDILPFVLGKPVRKGIENINPGDNYRWKYHHTTERRGIYRWHNVELASGAPLGLFWSRRQHNCEAIAFVYPTVLPLTHCPLIDDIGLEESIKGDPIGRPLQTASDGIIRSLRPYRPGDPMRLVHWRSSARYGELRVRELDLLTGGQDVIIALDSSQSWSENNFEQAVTTAASLYFYALKQQMQVQLWTAKTGLVKGKQVVLETLAGTLSREDSTTELETKYPVIWLSENSATLTNLPLGSRWVLWSNPNSFEKEIINQYSPGIILDSEQPLQLELQRYLTK